MGKLKTPWVKTDIPKSVKVKLWHLMKDNPTFDTFHGQVSKHFDEIFAETAKKEGREEKYGSLSRDTYNGLKYEIMHMPIEEVRSLPSDLKVWVEGLRTDLQEELLVANRTSDEDSLITKDRERHFEEVWQLAREWSRQIYFYCDSEDEYITRKDYPRAFEPTDAQLGTHVKGPLEWTVEDGGSVHVSFDAERYFLFSALREHLLSEELWTGYEELKSWLLKGIQQAGERNTRISVHDKVNAIRKKLTEELETLLAKHKHWFPGKCHSCP